MKRRRPLTVLRKRYPTLRALVSGMAEGAITPPEMTAMLDAIEQGIGLEKRDKAIAEALEAAPDTFEDHPMFQAGLQTAVDAIRAHAATCAIVGCTSPGPHEPAQGGPEWYAALSPEDRASFDHSFGNGRPQTDKGDGK